MKIFFNFLVAFAVVALLVLGSVLTCQAAPKDAPWWRPEQRYAAKIEMAENAGLVALGFGLFGLLWWVGRFVNRHWKAVLIASAVAGDGFPRFHCAL